MFGNLKACGLNPEKTVQDAIKLSILRYVQYFNLRGMTGQIRNELSK